MTRRPGSGKRRRTGEQLLNYHLSPGLPTNPSCRADEQLTHIITAKQRAGGSIRAIAPLTEACNQSTSRNTWGPVARISGQQARVLLPFSNTRSMPSTIQGKTASLIGTSAQTETLQAAILGSDLILASLPAEPLQVINACFALGYDIVVPASLGDELIASSVLDELGERPPGTTIHCSCPNARKRLLSAGNELSPFILNTVAPPVAAARYLRAAHGAASLHVTFIGSCGGADDESVSERLTPAEFVEICTKRGVSLTDQPRIFESCIPTDRRRHFSLPGGLPAPEAVRAVHPGTDVLSMDASGLAFDLTQCIISGRAALLDIAPAVGCPCSGFVGEFAWNDGRETIAALEPPRSPTPVVDSRLIVDLELPGNGSLVPSFEESVPFDVVVGADLSEFGREKRDAHEGTRVVSQPADTSGTHTTEMTAQQNLIAQTAAEIEFSWSDTEPAFENSAGNDPAHASTRRPASSIAQRETTSADSGSDVTATSEQISAASGPLSPPIPSRPRGTPNVTPALRTPSGPLPRAYLMQRRLVTGEHPTLPVAEVAPENPPEESSHPDSAQLDDEMTIDAQPSATTRTGRSAVDSVLDILSKAIRDVVEP